MCVWEEQWAGIIRGLRTSVPGAVSTFLLCWHLPTFLTTMMCRWLKCFIVKTWDHLSGSRAGSLTSYLHLPQLWDWVAALGTCPLPSRDRQELA